MRSPFRSQIKVTQVFGNNPTYYSKFGLKGHEGLDLIPTGTVWEVLALADGVVIRDVDDPRSGAYGIWLTIWHPSLKKATQYCHLKENYVKEGDQVMMGAKIGTMGATGNSTGAHLHLNLYDVDDNGVRLNKDNGYNGGIDPLPFLQAPEPTNGDAQAVLDQLRAERDTNWTLYQDQIKHSINQEDSINILKKQNDGLTKEVQSLKDNAETSQESLQGLRDTNAGLVLENTQLKADKQKAEMDLSICKSQRKDLAKYETKELINEVIGRIFGRR